MRREIFFRRLVEELLNLLLQHAPFLGGQWIRVRRGFLRDFRALGATSGRRQTGSSRPISAMAALAGPGFDSMKFISMSGRYCFCSSRARAKLLSRQAWMREVISAGISLATTEITPWPPRAMTGSAMASSPERTEKFSGAWLDDCGDLADVAGGFFYAGDIFDFCETC